MDVWASSWYRDVPAGADRPDCTSCWSCARCPACCSPIRCVYDPGSITTGCCWAEGNDERGRAVPDRSDAVGQARQGRARRAGHPLPIGYVAARPARPPGSDEQAQHVVRLVFSAFAGWALSTGAPLPGWSAGPAAGPCPFRAGQGGAGVAAPTRETLQIMLHNRFTPGTTPTAAASRAAPQGAGPAQHRPGGHGQQRVAGPAAGQAAGLHHPEQYEVNIARMAATGRPRPRRRAAGRVGAAVRAAALRPLRRHG